MSLSSRAIGASFFETVSYAFCDKQLLQKYGFQAVLDNVWTLSILMKPMIHRRI